MKPTVLAAVTVLALSTLVSIACGEPFLITAQSTSGPAQTINVTGSSLPDLVSNLIKDQAQFSTLQNQALSATVKYGGVSNAITFSKNAGSTSATIRLPGIGFTKTFTAKNQDDLEHQIKDFARKNGADIYGNFLRSINASSDIGVSDGNPLAATALLARQSYTQFGIQPTPWRPNEGVPDPLDEVATPNMRLDFNGGYSHSDTGSSYFISGAFSAGARFSDRVGLVFTTPFTYRNVQGADVYNLGEEISLPLLLVQPRGRVNASWLLTPTFFAGAAGSVDLASGGTFLGGGLTSSFSFSAGGFLFTIADQADYFRGFPIHIGQYKFKTNLDQEMLKNGGKISKFFGNNLFIDAGLTYSNFLERAAVKEFWSPEAGLGFRFGPNSGCRIGYAGDFGHDFIVHGGEIQFYLNY